MHTLYAQLSWSQYKLLLSIDSQDKREFYIAETIKNNWTVRQLERQIYSSLYERLSLSNDKESVLAVAKNEKKPSDAKEIIKDPMYLEFLGLKRECFIGCSNFRNQVGNFLYFPMQCFQNLNV